MTTENTKRIAELNDQLRTTFSQVAGKVMLTQGIRSLNEHDQAKVLNLVKTFNNFTADNNPYGERDFGTVNHDGKKVFFKIDYYNEDLTMGSEDPADPTKTTRVMTVMLASEY